MSYPSEGETHPETPVSVTPLLTVDDVTVHNADDCRRASKTTADSFDRTSALGDDNNRLCVRHQRRRRSHSETVQRTLELIEHVTSAARPLEHKLRVTKTTTCDDSDIMTTTSMSNTSCSSCLAVRPLIDQFFEDKQTDPDVVSSDLKVECESNQHDVIDYQVSKTFVTSMTSVMTSSVTTEEREPRKLRSTDVSEQRPAHSVLGKSGSNGVVGEVKPSPAIDKHALYGGDNLAPRNTILAENASEQINSSCQQMTPMRSGMDIPTCTAVSSSTLVTRRLDGRVARSAEGDLSGSHESGLHPASCSSVNCYICATLGE